MDITIEINTDNEAFKENTGGELASILRQAAEHIEDWPGANSFVISLRDSKGKSVVGKFEALESE